MMKVLRPLLLSALLPFGAGGAMAQSASSAAATPIVAAVGEVKAPARAGEQPQFNSPEVSLDGRVTVRVYQPRAQKVTISGEWDSFSPSAMTKDDFGVWSFSAGPLTPNVYEYSITADDLPTLDWKNPNVKGGTHNLVEVRGALSPYFISQAGPKGSVHTHLYDSKATGTQRRLHVYTPPNYESSRRTQYPVLYLLHGSGDDDSGWTSFFGRANVILDNLIARGQAVPMIVVMPHGHVNIPNRELRRSETYDVFEKDLLGDVMPLIEKSYRTRKGRDNRALAGLSMGGGQTVVVGLKHPELFSAYGVFSAGIWDNGAEPFETAIAAFKQSKMPNKVLWIGIGKRDFVYDRAQILRQRLRDNNIRFTYYEDNTIHSWPTWRDYLNRFAPLLFRNN